MKNCFLIQLFLVMALNTVAQSDSLKKPADTPRKNHIAVNASSFLEKMFKQTTSMDIDNSFLYYTRDFKYFSLRAGINGLNSSTTSLSVKSNDKTITNKFMTSASVGILKTKRISRRFDVAYGINLFGAYADSSVTFVTSFDKVKNYSRAYHYGVAPALILKYNFSKRISAFAEYKLPIKAITLNQGTEYDAFPDYNSNDIKSVSYSLTIYNPILIYLSCSF